MKKILFIVNNLKVGGIEKVCWEIVSNLDSKKYQCDFLVAVKPGEDQYYDTLVENIGCSVYKSLRVYSTTDKRKLLKFERELIKKNHYDVVHSHVDFMNAWTLKAAKSEKVPVRISHVHTTLGTSYNYSLKNKFKYKIQQMLLNYYSTHRLACSKQAGIDYYGNDNFKVLYNGFSIDEYLNIDKTIKNKKNIVTVGRICEQKNPEFIVEIMRNLLEIDDSYELYWVGDGHLRNKTEQMITSYGIDKSIHMVGATTDIFPYLKECSIAIYPSTSEGLGISIVEAQLAHCFTYYSDVVPEEADVGYGVRLSLKLGAQQWAKKINEDVINNANNNYSLDMKKVSFYDRNEMINTITDIYG